MITGEKEFGTYKLTKVNYYDDEEDEASAPEEFVSSCYFGSKWVSCTLDRVLKYNSDTSIFRFALPDVGAKLNLPIGGVLLARAVGRDHDGSDAIRPYASITDNNTVGYFEVLCKRYDEWGQKETPTSLFFGATNHAYKPPGAMSEYIHSLVPSQTLEFKRKICVFIVVYYFLKPPFALQTPGNVFRDFSGQFLKLQLSLLLQWVQDWHPLFSFCVLCLITTNG